MLCFDKYRLLDKATDTCALCKISCINGFRVVCGMDVDVSQSGKGRFLGDVNYVLGLASVGET
jgi:hypothetical protein